MKKVLKIVLIVLIIICIFVVVIFGTCTFAFKKIFKEQKVEDYICNILSHIFNSESVTAEQYANSIVDGLSNGDYNKLKSLYSIATQPLFPSEDEIKEIVKEIWCDNLTVSKLNGSSGTAEFGNGGYRTATYSYLIKNNDNNFKTIFSFRYKSDYTDKDENGLYRVVILPSDENGDIDDENVLNFLKNTSSTGFFVYDN